MFTVKITWKDGLTSEYSGIKGTTQLEALGELYFKMYHVNGAVSNIPMRNIEKVERL